MSRKKIKCEYGEFPGRGIFGKKSGCGERSRGKREQGDFQESEQIMV